MKHKILFVCLGNICRSPSAEAVMKKIVEDNGTGNMFFIDSAGTSGWHNGESADARTRQHAAKRGYKMTSVSRQFKTDDFDKFDLIVAMDDNNYYDLQQKAITEEHMKKIVRMADYKVNMDFDHVPDPYYGGTTGFELVLDILEDACEGLYSHLMSRKA